MSRKKKKNTKFLMCERNWVYYTLITAAGFFGAYTFLLRGNVFCNAQTGNIVLMGLALGEAQWEKALYYLIPISAYLLGALISELFPNPVKHNFPIRWDTLLIGLEMLIILMLGFIPDSAPVQISQVIINFIASMQYNTFRQAEGVPMSTTFATNHIRQIGIGLAREIKHFRTEHSEYREKFLKHLKMLIFFLVGSVVGTVLCNIFMGKAIWFTLIPLGTVFSALFNADLTTEKDLLEKKPSGH